MTVIGWGGGGIVAGNPMAMGVEARGQRHEIRAGNGDRLIEIAAKIKPWLRRPSINGADIDSVNDVMGWKRGIQPLTMGDYDSSQLLEALKSIEYKGPVILHTWGLQKAAADHHHTSFKRFYEMLDTK